MLVAIANVQINTDLHCLRKHGHYTPLLLTLEAPSLGLQEFRSALPESDTSKYSYRAFPATERIKQKNQLSLVML